MKKTEGIFFGTQDDKIELWLKYAFSIFCASLHHIRGACVDDSVL